MTCLADISIYRQACFGLAVTIALVLAVNWLCTKLADLRQRFLSLPDDAGDDLAERDGGGVVDFIHNGGK